MKRLNKLSITLALSFLLSLVSLASIAKAQTGETTFTFETGLIIPGPHQKLRLTVNGGSGNDTITVRFRRSNYTQGVCNGGVCKFVLASQIMSDPIRLAPGEAASNDIWLDLGMPAVCAVVISDNRNVRVTAMIIDTVTGKAVEISGIGMEVTPIE